MGVLSTQVISEFVKVTNDNRKKKQPETLYGTTVEHNGTTYVRLDGSELLTPVSKTTAAIDGDRVEVTIKNHTATITGNTTSPAAREDDVGAIGDQVSQFETVLADKVSTKELTAVNGRIDNLVSENVTINNTLNANKANIDDLVADNVTINGKLTATEADIDELRANKLSATDADLKYATINQLEAVDADIHNLDADIGNFKVLTTDKFLAQDALIDNLEANKLSVKDAEIKYANIDFTNIGQAAMEYFYAKSGLIENVIVGDQTITGDLVGVTISGDLIKGNTIVAEKLVIRGEDGLYYKLNTDGMDIEAEQTDENSLNGSLIQAKSITASKISVTDLVAFDATIGGFKITDNAIHSVVKDNPLNTTRGIYMDNSGQLAFGDASNFIRYYKDAETSEYKLEISASSIKMVSKNITVEDELSNIRDEMSTIKEEVTTLLRIESSRGTVFKNDQIATTLSAVIYRGNQRIIDMPTLKAVMGSNVYLQWSWQRLDDESFGVISADDTRIGMDGFTFTLSPADVDTKVTFLCQLMDGNDSIN